MENKFMNSLEKAHKYLGVTIELRLKFEENYHRAVEQGLSFMFHIITVSGVIAGFGFTGLGEVSSRIFFVVGEALLFLNICIGLLFIKLFWYDDIKGMRVDIKSMAGIADSLKTALKDNDEEKTNKGIDELESFGKQEREMKGIFSTLPVVMIALIFTGGTFLLLSVLCVL